MFVTGNGKRGMVQLPNGDMWIPPVLNQSNERPDTMTLEGGERPDDVVADIISSQKGEMLSCTMCGQQFSRRELNELRSHIETLHPASTKPPTNFEVALAQGTELNDLELLGTIELPPIK